MRPPDEIFQENLMWPVVKAMQALDGAIQVQNIGDKVIELEGFGKDLLEIPHSDKSDNKKTAFRYQLPWALTRLRYEKIVENVGYGLWKLTDKGQTIEESDIDDDMKMRTRKPPVTP